MFKRSLICIPVFFIFFQVSAQNSLPDFSVDYLGKDKNRISWNNQYGASCIQINIQRSYDSVRNFHSILSVQSPELPQNGFIDADQADSLVYYRIFYVLNGGAYYFTKPLRATRRFVNLPLAIADSSRNVVVRIRDTVYRELPLIAFHKFRDSILYRTKDTLVSVNPYEIALKPYVQKTDWVPSIYVFTDRDGYVTIHIPDVRKNNYQLIFFDSDNHEIFSIKHLEYPQLVLDKADFIHSGWFSFELYENSKLKEKNKFYLQKDAE